MKTKRKMKSQSQSAKWAIDVEQISAAEDPYNDRDRQGKALLQFERQKAAWDKMQTHLLSATAPSASSTRGGSAGRHAASAMGRTALNMTHATAAARAKREDNVIVEVATSASANQYGSYAWEGLLRCTSERDARRLVPIGRACVPYPLYGEARMSHTLPDDHPLFTRVVAEEDALDQQDGFKGTTSAWKASNKSMQERTVALERVKDALANGCAAAQNSKKAASCDLFTEAVGSPSTYADATDTLSPASYYEEQLRRFAPYVQERLGHFLQPRVFLDVEGRAAPFATAEDEAYLRDAAAAAAADGRPASAPPVEYFPPPLPPPPQTQFWASSAFTSRVPSRNGHNNGGGQSTRSIATSARRADQRLTHASTRSRERAGEDGNDNGTEGDGARPMPRGSIDTAQPHFVDSSSIDGENPYTQRTQPPSPLHPMRVLDASPPARVGDHAAETARAAQRDGPAMELSTRALFFHTRPRELQQGSATLRNMGTTTIYYSWTVMDAMQEHLRELHEAAQEGGDEDDETSLTNGDVHDTDAHSKRSPKQVPQTDPLPFASLCLTHQLAAHQHRARDAFFFMSSPMNGVVLPGEAVVFPFSVRATREGLFQNTYELLTVPPAPERIFVRLRALVQRAGPSLQWLAKPVADALDAKVLVDAQRRLAQKIGADTRAMETSELRARLAAEDGAADVARQAEREKRAAQAEAWHRANRLTFDHVPYCTAAYDKLERLSAVVKETFLSLNNTEVVEPVVTATPQHERLAPAALPSTPRPPSTTASTAAGSPNPRTPQTQKYDLASRPSSSAPHPVTIQWDGALLPLLYQIMSIRDSALRQVFLDAMQVLLRAARASRDVADEGALQLKRTEARISNMSASSVTVDDSGVVDTSGDDAQEDGESLPLPVLLSRAAAALADVVVSRQRPMVEKQCEDSLLQPARPAAALALTASTSGDGGSAVGTTAGGGGSSKNRATSAAPNTNAAKKSVAAPRSGRGTVAPAADAKENKNQSAGDAAAAGTLMADGTVNAAAAAATTPAQRLLLSCITSAELQGFAVTDVSAEVMTALRAAEERVVRAHMEEELAEAKAAFTRLHTALFREVVDAACDRGPLATCTTERLAELRAVQQSPLLSVDVSVDPLVAPPVGKPGKRK